MNEKMLKVTVTAPVYTTEVRSKVSDALHYLFKFDDADLQVEPAHDIVQLEIDPSITYEVPFERLLLKFTQPESLLQLHTLFRTNYIVEAARGVLYSNRRKGIGVVQITEFLLNKQAAFSKKIHFCDENESSLGPIKVEIQSDDLDAIIDWLTPRTKDGEVLEPDTPLA